MSRYDTYEKLKKLKNAKTVAEVQAIISPKNNKSSTQRRAASAETRPITRQDAFGDTGTAASAARAARAREGAGAVSDTPYARLPRPRPEMGPAAPSRAPNAAGQSAWDRYQQAKQNNQPYVPASELGAYNPGSPYPAGNTPGPGGGTYVSPRQVPTTSISGKETNQRDWNSYDPGRFTGGAYAGYIPGGAGSSNSIPLNFDDMEVQSGAVPVGPAPRDAYVRSGSFTARTDSGYGDSDKISKQVMNDLRRDYGLNTDQAAGVVGNLLHESNRFQSYQELNPTAGRGGAGWAQWTGDRRTSFENYVKENKLDPNSYAANYGFLKHELATDYKSVIPNVKKAKTAEDAMYAFEDGYEKAGVPNYASRMRYANALVSGTSVARGGTAGYDKSVADLQQSLVDKGAQIAIDGLMGPRTQAAMQQFGAGPGLPAAATPGLLQQGIGYVQSGANAMVQNSNRLGRVMQSPLGRIAVGVRGLFDQGRNFSDNGGNSGGGRSYGGSVGSYGGGAGPAPRGMGGAGIGGGIGGAINPNKMYNWE